jgi:hypothetical protein
MVFVIPLKWYLSLGNGIYPWELLIKVVIEVIRA